MALNNGPLDNLCCLQLGDDGDCVASSTACKRIQAQMTHGWFTTDLPRDSTFFFVIARTADKRNVRDKHFGPGDTGKARHTATSHHTFKTLPTCEFGCLHTPKVATCYSRSNAGQAWLPHLALVASSLASLPRSVFFQARAPLSFNDETKYQKALNSGKA